ncbi:MAG: DUF4124 domain-containing protein [Pseudomonadota bacterium]
MLTALPSLSQADIYKWKDKDGVTRYSDTPPPSNVKLENIGTKKVIKPTGKEPLSIVTDGQPAPVAAQQPPAQPPAATSPEDAAAKLRQQTAETEKNNKQEKETQAKLKAENCRAAKANLASYEQGGRVYKMNEKGEREYLDDAGLKQGADKARTDVAQFCS